MVKGWLSLGGPEMSLALAAQAEVAQSFGLPTWGLAGATNAKVLDAQAGVEATFQIMAQSLSGINLIHDVGYMDMSKACGVEQLILGDEIIGMVKRFMRGVVFTPDQMGRGLLAQVGPGGEFLSHSHTLKNFKKELWRPTIFTRDPIDVWRDKGEKDTQALVAEKIYQILQSHQPNPLSDSVLDNLERIKNEGQKVLTR
jgi:trimethylamine--corrinoid protein Co-methyltransferase